jgi:uncharacterized phage protein gp47/JayE
VQQAIALALQNYTNGAGINGTLRVSTVVELVMLITGVIDISGVTINGVAANLTLGSSTTFVVASGPAINFSYVTQ